MDEQQLPSKSRRRGHPFLISALVVAIVAIVAYTQLTIFIIPPIGALPDGKTLVILRLNKTEFVDSPDAMCERIQGGVSVFCRAMSMGAVAGNATIIARLPYSSSLYLISTDGKTYER